MVISLSACKETENRVVENPVYTADMNDTEFNEGHKYMFDYLNNISGVTIETSNAIWLRDEFEVKPEFINQSIEVFDAYVDQLDFDKKSSINKMNEWIFEKTHEKITNMIESPIDKSTQMILANTVYFYGDWEYDFREESTKEDDFTNSDGSRSTVMMMFQKTDLDYNVTDEYRAIKLPYKDSDVVMYALMPEGELKINELLDLLTTDKWNVIKNDLIPTHKVQLRLPTFFADRPFLIIIEDTKTKTILFLGKIEKF